MTLSDIQGIRHYCPKNIILKLYRAEKKSLQILLNSTQAGPGRKVKQELEEISRNHIQTFIYLSVLVDISHLFLHITVFCRRRRR